MSEHAGKPGPTLVVGLGNPILRDDGVGPLVVERLRASLAGRSDVAILVDTHGGLRLMERLVGARRAIVVDAILTGAPAGTLWDLGPGDLPTAHSGSSHDASLPEALAVGRALGAVLPADGDLRLLGIEAADVYSFGESCTPAVEDAVPRAVERVLALLACEGEWDKPAGRIPGPARPC